MMEKPKFDPEECAQALVEAYITIIKMRGRNDGVTVRLLSVRSGMSLDEIRAGYGALIGVFGQNLGIKVDRTFSPNNGPKISVGTGGPFNKIFLSL